MAKPLPFALNTWIGRLTRSRFLPAALLTEERHGLVFAPPCYYVRPLRTGAVVLDCGAGCDANFSQALMQHFGATCIAVDPTPKHQANLSAIERGSQGRFRRIAAALAVRAGSTTFFESATNESGSLYQDHVNVRQDAIRRHEVPAVTLEYLLARAGPGLDLLKMDIEGAEYEVLAGLPEQSFASIRQLIVEFHHGLVERWTRHDTDAVVRKFRRIGFLVHTRDGINYLFFQHPGTSSVRTGSARGEAPASALRGRADRRGAGL